MKDLFGNFFEETSKLIVKKVRCPIDEMMPWQPYAGSIAQEFEKNVFDLLLHWITDEQRERIGNSGLVNLTYLNPVNKNRWTETNAVTIEIVVNDQLVGLLHDRRTEFNNSEITSIIFTGIIQRERKRLIELLNKQ